MVELDRRHDDLDDALRQLGAAYDRADLPPAFAQQIVKRSTSLSSLWARLSGVFSGVKKVDLPLPPGMMLLGDRELDATVAGTGRTGLTHPPDSKDTAALAQVEEQDEKKEGDK